MSWAQAGDSQDCRGAEESAQGHLHCAEAWDQPAIILPLMMSLPLPKGPGLQGWGGGCKISTQKTTRGQILARPLGLRDKAIILLKRHVFPASQHR